MLLSSFQNSRNSAKLQLYEHEQAIEYSWKPAMLKWRYSQTQFDWPIEGIGHKSWQRQINNNKNHVAEHGQCLLSMVDSMTEYRSLNNSESGFLARLLAHGINVDVACYVQGLVFVWCFLLYSALIFMLPHSNCWLGWEIIPLRQFHLSNTVELCLSEIKKNPRSAQCAYTSIV